MSTMGKVFRTCSGHIPILMKLLLDSHHLDAPSEGENDFESQSEDVSLFQEDTSLREAHTAVEAEEVSS